MGSASNVGSVDKAIRLVVGLALGVWAIVDIGIGSTVGIIALVVAAILLLTGLVSFCPLFKILGINSLRTSK